jgi:hypothetical protein
VLLDRADELMNPNVEAIEINIDHAGILQMFYKSNIAYTYWNKNNKYIISKMFHILTYRTCYEFLKIAFHYYVNENVVNKTRIAKIWCDVLDNAFIKETIEMQSHIKIRITMMLYKYYSSYFVNLGSTVEPTKLKMPLIYIKHIVSTCINTDIYKTFSLPGTIYSHVLKIYMETHLKNIKFEEPNADIDTGVGAGAGVGVNSEGYKYKLDTSLFELCSICPIHKNYIEKIITTRLLCLKHYTDTNNSEHATHNHVIYNIVNDYLRNNKYLLFN